MSKQAQFIEQRPQLRCVAPGITIGSERMAIASAPAPISAPARLAPASAVGTWSLVKTSTPYSMPL